MGHSWVRKWACIILENVQAEIAKGEPDVGLELAHSVAYCYLNEGLRRPLQGLRKRAYDPWQV